MGRIVTGRCGAQILSVLCGKNQMVVSWVPPTQDQYKTNCCLVFDKGKGRIGFGIIIRNSKGEIMASSAQFIEAKFSIKMSQLLDIKKSIMFGNEVALSNISKKANMPAAALAKEALKISEDAFWMEESPPFIYDLVKADMPV
ncbi:hypothetical protein Dsin_000133 [Dipteronia sinensis]|uniref:RNase H type-1 domain-containing protein n=1 Tax=Dipteronia sinensis TaxID=43782 RepID=A0AAD9Z311_9ROSI|nr:hypothetical protein Dsin_000133 [Dipteronia sinensis]